MENIYSKMQKILLYVQITIFTLDAAVLYLLLGGDHIIWLRETYYLPLIGANIILFFLLLQKKNSTKRRRLILFIIISFILFIQCSATALFHPYEFVYQYSPSHKNSIIIEKRKDLWEARISHYRVFQQKHGFLMKRLSDHVITITVPEDSNYSDKEIFDYRSPQWLDEHRFRINGLNGPYLFRLD